MMGGYAMDGFHAQQCAIIGRPEILGHPALRDGLVPQHRASLPSQSVPGLVISSNDRLIETAFEGFQLTGCEFSGEQKLLTFAPA